ncbi:hypothetical protein V9T40_003247 [Parthenolecanium corni]|uniref:LisH domain-containing protein n=1 Tax=Parthenolecanium corni TaxID=536013 RepID=A0AAN9U2F0_9HEMI
MPKPNNTEAEQEKLLPEKSGDADITYSDIAAKLLTDRLLLTALELHCELTESGKEIPKLKEFFSNPGNFEQNSKNELSSVALTRWSSQATLDSLDMTRFSEDGEKIFDDKVAVLEFELRKAKETINALRTNLTVATECETLTKSDNTHSKSASAELIKPHEQRALNFLINEYLLLHGYKLTSITFADENENQDFEVWDDVGLNIPKPPELLHLFRESMRNNHFLNTEYQSVSTQTEGDIEEVELLISQLDKLKMKISDLEAENKELSANIDRCKNDGLVTITSHFAAPTSETGSIPEHFIMVDSCQVSNSDNTETIDDTSFSKLSERLNRDGEVNEDIESDDSTSQSNEWLKLSECGSEPKSDVKNDILSLLNNKCGRNLPAAFQKEILSRCYIDAGQIPGSILMEQCETDDSLYRVIHIVAGSLPRIIPNISPNHREDAILLLTYGIRYHPSAEVREKLIQLLFNLKKKPKDDERKAILSSIVWLACNSSVSLMEEELLPLCWEEVNHKYVERRLLISELCCTLIPFLPVSLRNSLLLSILQQILLEDKEDRTKISAINSIAFLVTFIDEDDKYPQCEELLFTGLQDSNSNVVEATIMTLLPALTKWAFDLDKLQSHLITRLLRLLETQIQATANQVKGDTGSPFKQTLLWETRCSWTIGAIRSILPFIVMHVANAPIVLQAIHPNLPTALPRSGFSDVCRGLCNPVTFYEGKYSLGEIIRAFDVTVTEKTWAQLEWFTMTMIPKLLDAVDRVDVSQESLLSSFVSLFHCICSGFGKAAIIAKVKPSFLEKLKAIESKLANVSEEWPSLCVLPVYLLAILVPFQEVEEIQTTLRKFLFMLPICGYPIGILEYCVKELNHVAFIQETLLTTLWEGVVHPREAVRVTVVKLFSVLIPSSTDFVVINRIIPAILTLSNDQDTNVKSSTVQVFGKLIAKTSVKEVLDKCCFQLQTLLSEQNVSDNHILTVQLITTLGVISSHVDSTFRDDVIVTQLAAYASFTMQMTNLSRKQELSRVLLDAYNLVIYCSFGKNVIVNSLIPGLKCLEAACADSAAQRETVSSMIREIEARIHGSDNPANPTISSVTANMGQEVKQRMSKIFQTPIGKQTKFWKK